MLSSDSRTLALESNVDQASVSSGEGSGQKVGPRTDGAPSPWEGKTALKGSGVPVKENASTAMPSSRKTTVEQTALWVSRPQSHKASIAHAEVSTASPSHSSTEEPIAGKRKREDQSDWERGRAEDQRKRNALYSKRNYYRKRQEFDNIQTQSYLLEEENFNLRKENKRLEKLLATAKEQVAIQEVMAGKAASVTTDFGIPTATWPMAAPPGAANPMQGLLAPSFLGQPTIDPNLLRLRQIVQHSVTPSPPLPNPQAGLQLAAAQQYATQQALSALGLSAARAPGHGQGTVVQEPPSVGPNVLNGAINLSRSLSLQPPLNGQPSSSLPTLQQAATSHFFWMS